MSGLGGFLKRNRFMLIVLPALAGEYYVWRRIQQMECYVPANERKEIFVHPMEYAKKLYAESSARKNDHQHHREEKTL